MHPCVLAWQPKLSRFVRAFVLPIAGLGLFSQSVAAANLPPTISGKPATYVLLGSSYSFTPTARDPERKTLSFAIAGKPSWASFSTKTGRLSGSPSSVGRWVGIAITVSDGVNARTLGPFAIRAVSPNNVAPTISGSPSTTATPNVAYSFQPNAQDANGDPLTFKIANRPSWASFNNTTGRLSGTPSTSQVGTYSGIAISVTDGGKTAALPSFSISVANTTVTNRAPSISGTPPTTATVGEHYSFRAYATDADGDSLAYSIRNKPSWANFDTVRGMLSGTPSVDGTHSNILISVSDGRAATSLRAFAITVSGGAAPNTPPVIGGTPATQVNAGAAYTFRPSASDADGDALTFLIANRPSWTSFNTATGQLSGTPSSSHAGVHSNIVISVDDGNASVSLPAFSINVSQAQPRTAVLSWTPPTSNTNGSALTNLAGYRIHYGMSANVLSQTIQIANPGLTTYVVENLAPGTYYFAVRAYTSVGTESDTSNVVSKIVR